MDQEVVQSGIDLVIDVAATVGLAVLNSSVDQLCILWLLGGGEDEGWVGGGILGLVLVDGCEIARVANDGLQRNMVSAISMEL